MYVGLIIGIISFFVCSKDIRGYFESLAVMICSCVLVTAISLPTIIIWQKELGNKFDVTEIVIAVVTAVTSGLIVHALVAGIYYGTVSVLKKIKK